MLRRFSALRSFLQRASEAKELCGRGVLAQTVELARLKRKTGLSGSEYFTYGFYSDRFSAREKGRFLTRALHEKYVAPLNPPSETVPFRDKAAFKIYYEAAGLRLPVTFGVFHASLGRDRNGAPLQTAGDLARVARELNGTGLVIKPAIGGCGEGVQVFSRFEGAPPEALVHVNGARWPLAELSARMSRDASPSSPGYLIEERVKQHAFLDEFNPATLHTTRVVTVRDGAGKLHLIGATLKLGVDDSGVESLPDGHVCVPVDVETGDMGAGAQRNGLGFRRIAVHPKSGVNFKGRRLPMWDKTRELALAAAEEAPMMRSLGWDIGLAEDGPVLIEANEIWGEEILQIASDKGLWTDEFRQIVGAGRP